MGADLLSQKGKEIQALKRERLLMDNEKWAPGEGKVFCERKGG